MAANNGKNVIVGSGKVGGYAFSAPSGSDLPTDSTTALDDAFVGLGYVSSDGVTRTVDVSTEDVQDWNLDVVRTLTTDTSVQISCVLIEINGDMLAELYGEDNVTVDGGTTSVKFTGEQLPRKSYVLELVDGESTGRFVIADGQVITPGGGELTFQKGAPIQHTLTVRAYRAESGEYFNHYTDDGSTSGS